MNQDGLGVRRRRHAPWFTDGPFAETKEQVGGYVPPPGRLGAVEVRPVGDREDLVARRVTAEASPASRR